MFHFQRAAIAAALLGMAAPAWSQETGSEPSANSFDRAWFEAYAPVTALDMVQRIPSFTLEEGATVRGLGGSYGNVLINGQYPSTKTNRLADILGRIAADDVARLDVLRASTDTIDLRGRSRVVNIVLREGGAGSTSYDALIERRSDGRASPQINLTHARFSGARSFSINGGLHFDHNPWRGTERVLTPDGQLIERRDFTDKWNFFEGAATGNFEQRLDRTLIRASLHTSYFEFRRPGHWRVHRPDANGTLTFRHGDSSFTERTNRVIEFNSDLEHEHGDNLSSEVTVLWRQRIFEDTSTTTPGEPGVQASLSDLNRQEREQILRSAAHWSGFRNHALRAGIEASRNTRDQAFALCLQTPTGCTPVSLPGSNAEVSEDRVDLFIADSWSISDRLNAELRLAREGSTLTVAGPSSRSQDFAFIKPSARLTWQVNPQTSWRLGLERQVGQLNFADFISVVDINMGSTNGGNPDLAPEHFWRVELGYETAWQNGASLAATASHDRITDVIDRVPVFGGQLDAPGNIGDGTRWRISVDATLPLDAAGLSHGRLDLSGWYETSRITDPLTGIEREISGQQPHTYRIALRQDLPERDLAWSLSVTRNGDPVEYRLNETRETENITEWSGYIESRHLSFGTLRLGIDHAFDAGRDRLITRGRPDITEYEYRRSRQGGRIYLQLRGTF